MNFLVVVTCALHVATCPIPNGIKTDIKVENKKQCEAQAKLVIAAYGYKESDFRISCEKKQ